LIPRRTCGRRSKNGMRPGKQASHPTWAQPAILPDELIVVRRDQTSSKFSAERRARNCTLRHHAAGGHVGVPLSLIGVRGCCRVALYHFGRTARGEHFSGSRIERFDMTKLLQPLPWPAPAGEAGGDAANFHLILTIFPSGQRRGANQRGGRVKTTSTPKSERACIAPVRSGPSLGEWVLDFSRGSALSVPRGTRRHPWSGRITFPNVPLGRSRSPTDRAD
jgi:hypothetical protein